jgi:hypothetical protein
MMAEWYILDRLRNVRTDFSKIPDFTTLPAVQWSSVIALSVGTTIGILTAGIIPGLGHFHVGVCSLQAWLASLGTYLILRPFELAAQKNRRVLVADRSNAFERETAITTVDQKSPAETA